MITELEYFKFVNRYYSFLENEFGFIVKRKTANGNAFYDIEYENGEKIISISYENFAEYLEVIVFILIDGKKPDYDDKSRTLHLKQLNQRVISYSSKEEISFNTAFFSKFLPEKLIEKRLIKAAMCLRLYLKIGSRENKD